MYKYYASLNPFGIVKFFIFTNDFYQIIKNTNFNSIFEKY